MSRLASSCSPPAAGFSFVIRERPRNSIVWICGLVGRQIRDRRVGLEHLTAALQLHVAFETDVLVAAGECGDAGRDLDRAGALLVGRDVHDRAIENHEHVVHRVVRHARCPDPVIRPRENSTGPRARTNPSLSE